MSGATRDARLVVSAPAKINLFFELLAKRLDGFHDVQTVMTTLNLCDTLTFTARPGNPNIEFCANWCAGLSARDPYGTLFGDLPEDSGNLVVRALHLLKQETQTSNGARVCLTKRIPSGAGLGGGSSDAAAALVAGNLGWNLGLEMAHLMRLASQLGSDVPFFLGPAVALCTGRGEQLTSLPDIPPMEVILVRPPESLATADVYGRSVVSKTPRDVPTPYIDGRIRSGQDLQDNMFNRLEQTADEMSEWIPRLRHEFSKAPFVAHQMSGSGSTYFGICKCKRVAKRTCQRLRTANLGYVMRARTGSRLEVYQARPSNN